MSDIDITLYLNKYRVRALSDALGNQTAETVEDKLAEAFDTLYQEYVPDEQRVSVEAMIESEYAAEQAKMEAARCFAVYHIRENGDDYHFTSDHFRSPMQAAYRYRLYERGEHPKHSPTLLLKRILSTSNISTRSAQTSIRIIESLLCSNLIWMKVGSVFTTAWITNGRPIPCVIFPLRPIKHSAPITEVRKGVVKYSIAALRGKNLIFRKNHQMILRYLI